MKPDEQENLALKSVEEFFTEIFAPGLVTSPPEKVEIRAGSSLAIPLGPTKREGERVKVYLGPA